MNENFNIDELLNSFIDGELTEKQRTELQRLIDHDPNIAKRLAELQKCKMLLGSLPRAEAPTQLAQQIKASLERRALLSPQMSDFDQRAGRKDLLVRKVLTAAAMLGLVVVLAAVIFNIVAPQPGPKKIVVSEHWTTPPEQLKLEKPAPAAVIIAEKTVAKADMPATQLPVEFTGTLELTTGDLVAVDAFIKRAIEDNGLFVYTTPASRGEKNVYILGCSRQMISAIMADLENVWHKFDSAALFIETDPARDQMVVEAVKSGQISEIVNQETAKTRVELAGNFAFLNNMSSSLPGREFLAAVDVQEPALLNIPKPVLTSSHKKVRKTSLKAQDIDVYLTIVITAANSKQRQLKR